MGSRIRYFSMLSVIIVALIVGSVLFFSDKIMAGFGEKISAGLVLIRLIAILTAIASLIPEIILNARQELRALTMGLMSQRAEFFPAMAGRKISDGLILRQGARILQLPIIQLVWIGLL